VEVAVDAVELLAGLDHPGGAPAQRHVPVLPVLHVARAVFYILVANVEATCAYAEQLGGSVVSRHLDPGPGAPKFAYLRHPAGDQFGVFTPPAA
jgi:predicted enzyme related to lactoylglutathione lyase